jgi:hypothetical protein
MKKLLAIIVVGLLFSGNSVFGNDIPELKIKNIKCLHKDYKKEGKIKKEDYLYLVFSDDRKTAMMINPVGKDFVAISKRTWSVRIYLKYIDFTPNPGLPEWSLNRKTGELINRFKLGDKYEHPYGICEPVEEGFDPLSYLQKLTKENLERIKKELIF